MLPIRLPSFVVAFVSTALALTCVAEQTADHAVQVTAQVQPNPAKIVLSWTPDSTNPASGYRISRRAPGAEAWGQETTLPGSATGYTDTSVQVGTPYEYQIRREVSAYTGFGYIRTGIEIPLVESRGKLILLVDDTKSAALARELSQLESDLAGDGWTVLRHDIAAGTTVPEVKAIIRTDYLADPQAVSAVFLFGHIPVPYSGLLYPDGHPEHQGAWPADVYYGDMEGVWTDTTVNFTQTANGEASDRVRLTNVPGDGKFDQTYTPGTVRLQVGRVDLANMPGRATPGGTGTFPSETEMLRNYLEKDHAFRQGQVTYTRRAIVGDYFGTIYGLAFASSGFRSFAPMFGPDAILQASGAKGTWLSTLRTSDFLWAYGCGGGSYTYADGLGSTWNYFGMTTELVAADPRAPFYLIFGSWFGDWDHEDDLMRAVLATPTHGLAAAWSGIPHWFCHPMAMGETFGYCARLTQNNRSAYGLLTNYPGAVHIALMGDPTLRMHVVAPPSAISATVGAGGTTLAWSASPDSGVSGYHLYRGRDRRGPFTRVNESFVTELSFTDAHGTSGDIYQVRAVKLESTTSGSYFNSSQAAYVTYGPPSFTVQPSAGTASVGSRVTLTIEASGASTYQWYKDGLAIAGATNASLTLDPVTAGDAGAYSVVATNSLGSTTSTAAALTVVSTSQGRLTNLSVRGQVGTDDQTMIVGFTTDGAGTKTLLVRGTGPTLASFGVTGWLPDPQLELYQGTRSLQANGSWRDDPNAIQIVALGGTQLGAYTLTGSESAMLVSLNSAAYTVHLRDRTGSNGVGLLEVIDEDSGTPGTPAFNAQPRLVNLSVRAVAGSGSATLIAGFIINGSEAKQVMIRGIGQTLSHFSVSGLLANPKLRLFKGETQIEENDNWEDAPNRAQIVTAGGDRLGEFALAATDAVLLLSLQPGAYTVHLVGAGDSAGVGMIEVNER